ncbi:MAG: hypothetical protein ACT4O3_04680 [Elusimicrobiota bacterium]
MAEIGDSTGAAAGRKKDDPQTAAVLSALLWPGAGQIYNGEKTKGGLMAAAMLALTIWLLAGAERAIRVRLPSDLAELTFSGSLAILLDALRANLTAFIAINLAATALWAYAVADAYFAARRRMTAGPARPPGGLSEAP